MAHGQARQRGQGRGHGDGESVKKEKSRGFTIFVNLWYYLYMSFELFGF
jgi:hypothetical protein